MNTTINSDLIRGNINTIILKALYEGDRYGYDIIKEIEQKSSGQYVLKQPTLYSCLKRLEVQGFIRSYWGAKSSGGRRKYYTLTDMGRELFLKNQSEWEHSRTVIDRLISDREADLSEMERSYQEQQSRANDGAEKTEKGVKTSKSQGDEDFDEDAYDLLEEEDADEDEDEDEDDDEYEEDEDDEDEEDDEDDDEESYDEDDSDVYISAYEYEDETDEDEILDLDEIKGFYETAKTADLVDDYEEEPIDPEQHQREYTDTSKLLDKLFSQEADDSEDNSYAQKLASDSYEAVPKRNPTPAPMPNYYDETAYSEDDRNATDAESIPYDTTPAPPMSLKNPPATDQPPATVQQPQSQSGFLRYDAKLAPMSDNERSASKRNYKSILGKLLVNQTTAIPEAAPIEENLPATIPVTKEMQRMQEATEKLSQSPVEPASTVPTTEEKFSEISTAFRELGDNIVVREHSVTAAREHESSLYYYPYRLMLVQFTILSAIMFFMVGITFLVARIGFLVLEPRDIWFYAVAVALAALFPITSAILNLANRDKKARIQYNFKSAIVHRMILLIGCILLTYCVNIYLEMPPTLSVRYACPLLLPLLYSLCLPINTIIFNALFSSGKYSA